MEIKSTRIVNFDEPLSKALDEVVRSGSTVVVMKDKSYCGIIDDRNIRLGLSDVSKTKCENVCIKAPFLYSDAALFDRLDAFMAGHFKALAVFDAQTHELLGLSTRIELLKDLLTLVMVPKKPVLEVMNTPVYTIDAHATVGELKSTLKQFGTSHLVVLDKGYPCGILSTLDLALVFTEPKERKGEQFVTQINRPDKLPVIDILRNALVTVDQNILLEDAVKKMVEAGTAHLLVLSDKKPVGVLTALDIFKEVTVANKVDKNPLSISGLHEDDKNSYMYIKDAVGEKLSKFARSFTVENATVHVKKGKSVYNVNFSAIIDREYITVASEDFSLTGAIDKVVHEFSVLLQKKKSKVKVHKRRDRVEP